MSWFDWLFKRDKKSFASNATNTGLTNLFSGRTVISAQKGHAVIPEDNSAVVSALRWAMRNYPKAPQRIERLVNGQYEVLPEHPALALLRKPSKSMSGRILGQAITLSLMLDGNAYIYKARNGNGKIAELQYLLHGCVFPVLSNDGTVSNYEYSVNGTKYTIPAGDVIHIKDGVDPSYPYLGWSGIKSIVNEILTDQEASDYSYAVLKNLGITGLMIAPSGDGIITEDQAELIKKRLKQDTTGDHRAEPIVFSDSVNITTNAMSPEQMALDKMRAVPESRICSVIGIPGMVLGLISGEERKTYANYAEARDAALEDWLLPLYSLIDEVLTCELLPEFGTGSDERVSRDLSQIQSLQEDVNDLATRLVTLYNGGVCTRAEARQPLGLPTSANDNVYYLDAQAAGLTTDQAKAYVKADILARRGA